MMTIGCKSVLIYVLNYVALRLTNHRVLVAQSASQDSRVKHYNIDSVLVSDLDPPI